MKYACVAAFLATILLANHVTTDYGMVPVGFGLTATAGTYLAGVTFVLRDSLQDAIRASLPNRLVHVQERHAVTAPGGRTITLPGAIRTMELPPSRGAVALRVVGVIGAGAALSFLVSAPFIAVASAAAFLLSELADLAIYTPLRERGYIRAAIASNVVGSAVDSLVFLKVAGFAIMASLPGQMVGKLTVTAVTVLLVAVYRARRTRRVQLAAG